MTEPTCWYRLVLKDGEPLTTGHVAEYWFEHARRGAPAWMPGPLARWWTRWRRLSGLHEIRVSAGPAVTPSQAPQRRRLVGLMGKDGTRYVPLADEDEVYRVLRQLEECGGA